MVAMVVAAHPQPHAASPATLLLPSALVKDLKMGELKVSEGYKNHLCPAFRFPLVTSNQSSINPKIPSSRLSLGKGNGRLTDAKHGGLDISSRMGAPQTTDTEPLY